MFGEFYQLINNMFDTRWKAYVAGFLLGSCFTAPLVSGIYWGWK